MGRDITVVTKHDNSYNVEIRSIVSSDEKVEADAKTVRFNIKPHKVFLFHKETEERIEFEATK